MGWQDTQRLSPDEGGERMRWLRLSGARSSGADATMVWLLGVMSFLMAAGGVWLLFSHYWAEMDSLVRVLSLSAGLVVMWVGYGLFAHWGWVSREVRGLLLSVTCLISVICLREALPGLHPWFLGLIFIGALLLVLALQPGRVAVTVLALACLGELVLLWLSMNTARDVASWALLWTCVLSVLMLWGISGGWCAVTYRSGYSTFSVISPIAFVLYLLVYHAMLLYPQYLRPPQLSGTLSAGQWIGMMVIWLLPMGFLLRVQCARAKRTNRPAFGWTFALYYLATIVSLPVGLLLLEHHMPVVGVCLLFCYAACIVCYGAFYRMGYFVVLGSLLALMSAVGIPLGIGISFIWSAAVMLALAAAFLAGALVLSRRRDNLLRAPLDRRISALSHTVVRPRPGEQAVLMRQRIGGGGEAPVEMPHTLASASPVGGGSITASFHAPSVPPLQVPSPPRREMPAPAPGGGAPLPAGQRPAGPPSGDSPVLAAPVRPGTQAPLPRTAQAAPVVPRPPRWQANSPASLTGGGQSPSDLASPDVSLRIPPMPGTRPAPPRAAEPQDGDESRKPAR